MDLLGIGPAGKPQRVMELPSRRREELLTSLPGRRRLRVQRVAFQTAWQTLVRQVERSSVEGMGGGSKPDRGPLKSCR